MLVYKGYKYRIYPTEQQRQLIEKTFGCCRFLYNQMLAERISVYEQFKDDKEILYSYKYKTEKQYKEEYEWLKDIDAVALQQSRLHLETAYKNFFKHQHNFPKFKNKKNHSNLSYTTANNSNSIRLVDSKHINLPKLKSVRIKLHRQLPINSIIKSATIARTQTNKYYVSILVQYELLEVKENQLNINNSIGLDYSSSDFYVDSDGNKAAYPRYYRLYQNQLANEQRKLSRMQKGSNNYKKQKLKVAKVHEKIKNLRLDFIHKLSHSLADTYDYVFVEDIDLRAMSQCLRLGKSTMDNGFGLFRDLLSYKMFERRKVFCKISRWQPTTIVCSECGSYHKDIVNSLDVRQWTCPDCGSIHDRDTNAAKNIKTAGMLAFQQ